jgi:hypothetical protein
LKLNAFINKITVQWHMISLKLNAAEITGQLKGNVSTQTK